MKILQTLIATTLTLGLSATATADETSPSLDTTSLDTTSTRNGRSSLTPYMDCTQTDRSLPSHSVTVFSSQVSDAMYAHTYVMGHGEAREDMVTLIQESDPDQYPEEFRFSSEAFGEGTLALHPNRCRSATAILTFASQGESWFKRLHCTFIRTQPRVGPLGRPGIPQPAPPGC